MFTLGDTHIQGHQQQFNAHTHTHNTHMYLHTTHIFTYTQHREGLATNKYNICIDNI